MQEYYSLHYLFARRSRRLGPLNAAALVGKGDLVYLWSMNE
jgi:hypothetical protein